MLVLSKVFNTFNRVFNIPGIIKYSLTVYIITKI